MSWLKKQWDDVRGNAKWDIFKKAGVIILALLTGIGILLRRWLLGLSLAVQLLTIAVVILSLAFLVVLILLLRERRRPRITISDGSLPPFIFPREMSSSGTATVKGTLTVGQLSPQSIAFKYQTVTGGIPGISVWIENNDIKPIEQCQLILASFSTYHESRRQFRKPTFEPIALFPRPITLEPEGKRRTSEGIFLARITQVDKSEIQIPTRDNNLIKTEGTFRAVFQIKAGDTSYRDELYFKWTPGTIPEVIPTDYHMTTT
jgi:hypothetical protein